tara:strand:+ start:583 stop:1482 length:900 start_codon:yes stop_codon:yes gene_type:complete
MLTNSFTFIIGAQKSGTTALHNLLYSHPEVSLPKIKETHFFSMNENYLKGIDWYKTQFDCNEKAMCEVDPSYLYFNKTADRIYSNIQSPKFIVVFRRPLERALSHYFMSLYRGLEEFPFKKALDMERERLKLDKNLFSSINHSYLDRGNYSKQLEIYLNKFNKTDFLFIKFEDLITDNKNKIKDEICSFMNISNIFKEQSLPKSNKRKRVKSSMIRDLLYKENYVKQIAKALVPSDSIRIRIKEFINSFNSEYYTNLESRQQVDDNLKFLPEKYFRWNNSQTKMISSLTSLDLNDWIYS